MNQTVRINTFETNSSSNHTVVITDTAVLPNLNELEYNIDIKYDTPYLEGFGDYAFADYYAEYEYAVQRKLAYLFVHEIGFVRSLSWIKKNEIPGKPNDEDINLWKHYQQVRRQFKKLFPKCHFRVHFDSESGEMECYINHQSQNSTAIQTIMSDVELIRWFLSDAGNLYLLSDGDDAFGGLIEDGHKLQDNILFFGDSFMEYRDPPFYGEKVTHIVLERLGIDPREVW